MKIISLSLHLLCSPSALQPWHKPPMSIRTAMSINSRSTSTPIFGEVDSIHWARLSSRTYSLLIFRELLAINSLRFSDSVLR